MKMFEVEKIISSREKKGEKQYLIKWVGYKEETWEPLDHLKGVKAMINKFEKQNKEIEPIESSIFSLLTPKKERNRSADRAAKNKKLNLNHQK